MLVRAATVTLAALVASPVSAETLTGEAAFGSWNTDAPGVRRHITPADMPAPFSTPAASQRARIVERGEAVPLVPEGFSAELLADGLQRPRTLRSAPNGDVFLAESGADRILLLRRSEDGSIERHVFAEGFNYPYGMALYPAGDDPQWLYVADTTRVLRLPYRSGETAAGEAEVVVSGIPSGGHSSRDLVFSADRTRILLSVGSQSNVASDLPALSADEITAFEQQHGRGAVWDYETGRAVVRAFDLEGNEQPTFATGIRNCSGLAVQPQTGAVWCAVNERDGLGDNLPPDYLSRIPQGSFFGWPWYYIGNHEDPRHAGARPDLANEVTVPDVLLQPHSAPLALAFYEDGPFPADFHGDGFATLHGSWNRGAITGYKVVRVIIGEDGVPTGEYEDFVTGFVLDDTSAWGRPSGVAVDGEGALLVSEDGSGTVWRITADD